MFFSCRCSAQPSQSDGWLVVDAIQHSAYQRVMCHGHGGVFSRVSYRVAPCTIAFCTEHFIVPGRSFSRTCAWKKILISLTELMNGSIPRCEPVSYTHLTLPTSD